MIKELELWQFIADRLRLDQRVVLLVVATSSGSSPGRRGYKMAVGEDGELIGSIGGGVMEVNLVNEARTIFSSSLRGGDRLSTSIDQVHRKNVPNASGMICSGKQTVIFRLLTCDGLPAVQRAIDGVKGRDGSFLILGPDSLTVVPPKERAQNEARNDLTFTRTSDTGFEYRERLGAKNDLYIIGGGHCALALSELMSNMDFHVSLVDDRPQLNTVTKNRFVDQKILLDEYERVDDHVSSSCRAYVVVMTLGYKTDAVVIRQLINKDFKYFGVLGSKAKMSTLFRELTEEGVPRERLELIRTPIGLPINSHSPEEIAVSIAAEIISVKNATG